MDMNIMEIRLILSKGKNILTADGNDPDIFNNWLKGYSFQPF